MALFFTACLVVRKQIEYSLLSYLLNAEYRDYFQFSKL